MRRCDKTTDERLTARIEGTAQVDPSQTPSIFMGRPSTPSTPAGVTRATIFLLADRPVLRRLCDLGERLHAAPVDRGSLRNSAAMDSGACLVFPHHCLQSVFRHGQGAPRNLPSLRA